MQNYVGQQIDRYRITERLGMGGMAVVYKAYDTRLERDVAIKLIRIGEIPESQYDRLLKRFEREAKSQARFDHKHIVHVYDYGAIDGSPYLVMSYLPGETLKTRMKGPLEWQQAVRWLIPVAEALAYAHKRGVIHRDVKPANILFDDEGQPILTDFGIAKILETDEATLTGTGLGVGTPEYMAPEQWQGKPCEATDQYALGVVLYELITGQKPYSADTPAAIILMQANEPLRAPSKIVQGIPEAVEKVLYKALTKDPENRYENMTTFRIALESLLMGKEVNLADKALNQDLTPSHVSKTLKTSTDIGKTYDALKPTPEDGEKLVNSTFKAKRFFLPRWLYLAGAGLVVLVIIGVIVKGSRTDDQPINIGKNQSSTSTTGTNTYEENHFEVTSTDQVLIMETPTITMVTKTVEKTLANTATLASSSDKLIYDDFNNSDFDGDFDHYLWRFWAPHHEGVKQQDGVLKIEADEFTNLIATDHAETKIDESYFYEANILLGEDSGFFGSATIKLHIDLNFGDYWTTQFGLLTPDIIFCEIGIKDTPGSIYVKEKKVDPKVWYRFRIEINPSTGRVDYYLDGEFFGSANIPVDEQGRFSFVIGIGPSSSDDPVIAYFDDVNFGPIR